MTATVIADHTIPPADGRAWCQVTSAVTNCAVR